MNHPRHRAPRARGRALALRAVRRRTVAGGVAGLLMVTGTASGLASVLARPESAQAASTVPAAAEVAPPAPADVPPPTAAQVTLVQAVASRVTIRSVVDDEKRVSATGRDLFEISEIGSYDVPSAALRAYKTAARTVDAARPGCDLPWTLLAGIGRVESDHGRYGGSTLGSDGLPRPAIVGIALDGQGPVAAIADSDDGRWDGDTVWDRAVGPMQFIPGTWKSSGKDGDGDGVANPNDLDDAALAAAFYLCPSSGSISSDAAVSAAIRRYNNSDYYVDLVRAFARGYETGVFVIPSPPPAEGVSAEAPKIKPKVVRTDKDGTVVATGPKGAKGAKAAKSGKSGATGASGKGGKASASGGSPVSGPTKPTGTGTKGGGGSATPTGQPGGGSPSTPTPPPPPPAYDVVTGVLAQVAGGFSVGGRGLDFADLGAQAKSDLDGDSVRETNEEELLGLLGRNVTVRVDHGTTRVVFVGDAAYL